MNAIFYCIAFIMFFVTLVGVSVNGSIVYVVLVNKHLQNVNNTFVVSMCINGFLISCFGTLFSAATSVSGQWIYGNSVCKFHSFIVFFLGLAIIATLTSMAIEKYIVIRFESRNLVTKRVCMYMILGCHLYGFVIAILPFLGWNRYQLEGYNITCSLKMDGSDMNSASFNIFMLIIGLICPLSVMVIVYSKVIVTMKEKRRSTSFTSYSCHRKTILKREMKVTKTILTMIGAFTLAWSPYAIHCVIAMLGLTKGMSPFVATVPALIAKSSVIYHPCIYVCKNRPLKSVIRKTFMCTNKSIRGVLSSLPLHELNVSSPNQKRPKNTMTMSMDDDADFSHYDKSNVNNGNVYEFPST